MKSRSVASLCREYAAFSREAALPLCEAQRSLGTKATAIDALCARILYLIALRSNELSSCASALRELPQISAQLAETRALLDQCTAHADTLNALLPATARVDEQTDDTTPTDRHGRGETDG